MFWALLARVGLLETIPLWVGGGIALLAALGLTPAVRYVAHRCDWIAYPRHDRWHQEPVALLGGIAIFGAGLLGGLGSDVLSTYSWPVWAGAVLVFLVGLADDLWGVRPEGKLIVQVGATALLLYAGQAFWRGGPFWVSIPLTFLWVIGITNAVNLLDGLDGLAASITAVAAATLGAIGVSIGEVGLAAVAVIMAGACLGFLLYNLKPATIFMGDCGSLFLGFMLSAVALGVQSTGEPVIGTLVPVVVLAVPIFDTTFVTFTRILSGRRIAKGATDHTHHRLIRLGLSERVTVTGLTGVSTLFALAALGLLWTTAQLFMAFLLLGVVASVVFGFYLAGDGSFVPEDSQKHGLTEKIGAVMRAVAGGVYWKSFGGVLADLLSIVAAFIAAAHLRFGGPPPVDQTELMVWVLPAIVVFKIAVFYVFGLYHGIWRHAGTPEAVRLIKASTLASLGTFVGLVSIYGSQTISVAMLVLDWMIVTGAVGGTRFGFRALRQYFAAQRGGGYRVLLYGSDDQALLVLRHLRQRKDRTVVGLLENEEARHGLRMQGVTVLGDVGALPRIVRSTQADEVIVPEESTSAEEREQIARRCVEAGVDCKYFAFRLEADGPPNQKHPSVGNGARKESPSPS